MREIKNIVHLNIFRQQLEMEIKTIQMDPDSLEKKPKKAEGRPDTVIEVFVGKIKVDVPHLRAEFGRLFFSNAD